MLGLVKKAHTYAGLLTFVNLAVFGLTGLFAPAARTIPLKSVEEMAFEGTGTDKQIAEAICRRLGLTLALPVQNAAIQRDAANRLLLDLWHANGHHRVTVMEADRKIRVEEYRVAAARYVDVLHMTTAVFRSGDWRMTAWAWYNEIALWNLGLMMVSGVWIWLAKGR